MGGGVRQAVLNRRANRSAARRARYEREREREEWEREVSHRMTIRIFGTGLPRLITLSYRYWQARACGWDALSKELATDSAGKPCDAQDSAFWQWWSRRHPEERGALVRLSKLRR